ncbi:hypothetical protein B005_1651 [Nocardiopsis alba ATCC BAA-2165]|uniref:Uncharacterized protein n=1 Tax=Nocardiopsis alba (strain ATCC BAA-2165 / BE74) TaxID=1205910 RepID=J7LC48_NOCAA|nr:hypothetical protein B005_1651 [Nocardiopsis alba ATCC BAA-2165]
MIIQACTPLRPPRFHPGSRPSKTPEKRGGDGRVNRKRL